ncbi:hypothetical protein OESDEN_23089, partial [Oesophagostomum dentatum]
MDVNTLTRRKVGIIVTKPRDCPAVARAQARLGAEREGMESLYAPAEENAAMSKAMKCVAPKLMSRMM